MLTDPLAQGNAVVAGSARDGTGWWQSEIAYAGLLLPQVSCTLGVSVTCN